MAFGGRRDMVAPTAKISAYPLSGMAPLVVNFDCTGSTDINGHLVSYSMDFGDGTEATGKVLKHTYKSAGTYTATLTVTDDQGLKHSNSALITVNTAK